MAMYVDSSTCTAGPPWNEGRVRPANLTQDDAPHISIGYSSERKVAEAPSSGLLAEESETEFIGKVPSIGKSVGREGVAQHRGYGAISPEALSPAEADEKERLLPTKRKQSAATTGKDYERIASRNKRALHATTYVEDGYADPM